MIASAWIAATLLSAPVLPVSPPSHKPAKSSAEAPASHAPHTAGDVFAELMEGNRRFVAGKPKRPHQDRARLKEQAKGQNPLVVIVGCADSRVPPELIFDQGVGDIFVVRAAGCLADVFALGSIEYAVEHLGVQHLLILGHEKCGAVKAAVDTAHPVAQKEPSHSGHGHGDPDEPGASSISALVAEILPAVEEAGGRGGDLFGQSIVINTRRSLERILEKSPMLKHRALVGSLKVACALYSLDTGAVKWTEKPSISGGFIKVHTSP
jgi:carbonic anhydrase